MKTWGIGIAGCGMIADFHAQAVAMLPNARVAGFCSRDRARAERCAEQHGGVGVDRIEDLVGRDDVDVLAVCTPSGAHLAYIEAAAQAGCHVVVEKPLEISLERCDAAIAACHAAGVGLTVIFPSRFHKASGLIREAVDAGRFGRFTLADAYVKWWRDQDYYDKGGWKGTRALDGGGALMNQSIHAIDLLQWFMGPVRRITGAVGALAHERIEVEDTGVATLEFACGALGVIEGSTGVFPGFEKRIELSGDAGSVVLREADIVTWRFLQEGPEDVRIRKEYARRTTAGGANDPSSINPEYHRRQFEDFLTAIEQGEAPLVTGEDARKSVEIILAIYEAARTGRAVDLPMAPGS